MNPGRARSTLGRQCSSVPASFHARLSLLGYNFPTNTQDVEQLARITPYYVKAVQIRCGDEQTKDRSEERVRCV